MVELVVVVLIVIPDGSMNTDVVVELVVVLFVELVGELVVEQLSRLLFLHVCRTCRNVPCWDTTKRVCVDTV